MIGHNNTVSEHETIKHKVFYFLMNLSLELDGKTNRIHVSITDLIDYIDEIKKCNEYNNQLGGAKHIKSLGCLKDIVERLTAGHPPSKIEVDDLLDRWMKNDVDLEYCQRPIKLY